MRIPPRLLNVSLLLVALYLPAAGQQPGSVNIRQRVVASTAGLPTVNVTVDRHRVPLGEKVTFTLSPESVVLNRNYIVTLDFGDDAKTEERKNVFVHHYLKPGNFRYSVSIRSSGKNPTPPPPRVSLVATPSAVSTNQSVAFSAQLSENYPNLKYRFVFADGSQTNWQDASQTKHEYTSAKSYLPYVDIGEATGGSVRRLNGSVRTAIEVRQPGPSRKPTVSLNAEPNKIEARQFVVFTARVVANEANVSYRFVFGDKTPATNWQANSQIRHRYLSAGNYSARVEARVMNRQAVVQSISSSPLSIEVRTPARPMVRLNATPTSVGEKLPVFFQAEVESQNEKFRYRFDFGDGSMPTAWTGNAVETHAYLRAGNYAPYVEIGRATTTGPINAIATGSRQVTVTAFLPPDVATPTPTPVPSPSTGTPTPVPSPSTGTPTPMPTLDTSSPSPGPTVPNIGGTTPSPGEPTPVKNPDGSSPNNWWWLYLLILLALFAGYQGWKWLAATRPTFHPRLDPGVSAVGVEKPLSIDFQVQLNPDIAAGEYGLKSNEGSFIRSEWKRDD